MGVKLTTRMLSSLQTQSKVLFSCVLISKLLIQSQMPLLLNPWSEPEVVWCEHIPGFFRTHSCVLHIYHTFIVERVWWLWADRSTTQHRQEHVQPHVLREDIWPRNVWYLGVNRGSEGKSYSLKLRKRKSPKDWEVKAAAWEKELGLY